MKRFALSTTTTFTVTKRLFCRLSLRGVLSSVLSCPVLVFAVSANPVHGQYPYYQSGGKGHHDNNYGVPLFHIDKSKWVDFTIDLPEHPKTAGEIEEQRNRDAQIRRSGREEGINIFPDSKEIIEGFRLRFHYRF